MPEITSVETIRTKLRDFESRVDGAIVAANALARVKTDAEKVLGDIQGVSTKSDQSFQKAEQIRLRLQEIQRDWETLKQQVNKAQMDSKEERDLLLSRLNLAIQSIGKKVEEAEERLKATNKASLEEQADLLNLLESSTRENAGVATNAKAIVLEQSEKLNQLLSTIRDEMHAEIRENMIHAEELLRSQLREQMDSFKREMKQNLSKHQQAIDRQLTDFLNKQNALVQNLTQQIDSYNRLTQAQSAELVATNSRLTNLSSALTAHKTQTATEIATLVTDFSQLKTLLAEVQTGLAAEISSVQSLSLATKDSLDETVAILKKSFFVGGKFK